MAAWTKLRKEMQTMRIERDVRVHKAAVARRHELEKQITKLESLPKDPSRTRKIKKLREELTGG